MSSSFQFILVLFASVSFETATQSAPPAPIAALAYRPDGKQLAVGIRGEVVLLDAAGGALIDRLPELRGPVTALAWHKHGNRLLIATGIAGKEGEIVQKFFPPAGAWPDPYRVIPHAHEDQILAMASSVADNFHATGSYDRLIKIWDPVAGGGPIRTLKDHSDSVYGIAFRPDGKLLASVAADRTVKIWDPATGVRLYSLNDPTDWVYAVAWSPDGKRVAAAGVDRSIRIWEIDRTEGKLVLSAFGHEKAVLKLAFTADGSTLYSLGEDRIVKAWDAAKLVEKKVYPAQPESVLSLAVRLDGKQIALGRYDGVLVLIDTETGKETKPELNPKPKPPKVNKIAPDHAPIGKNLVITVEGEALPGVTEVVSTPPGIKLAGVGPGSGPANKAQLIVQVAKDLSPGAYQLKFKGPHGESNAVAFHVDRFEAKAEPAGTESPRTAPETAMNSTTMGALSRAGEVDYFRLTMKAGDQVGVQTLPDSGSKLEPFLALEDADGNVVLETSNGVLGYQCTKAGTYVLSLRDREFRGGGAFKYRLHVGAIPIVTSFAPLGVPRGGSTRVAVRGVFIDGDQRIEVGAATNAAVGSKVSVPVASKVGTVLNAPSLVVGEFPQSEMGQSLTIPGTGSGVIEQPSGSQSWSFQANKGQPLIVEIEARRLGSPLDSVIEILDSQNRPVQRAVLRCVAKTFVTFRDHDSSGPGIRMDTWNEFLIDDYVLVGNELMRIKALPKNPDDDCQFYTVNGQRIGFLGTTPSYQALGTPMFRVGIHPPSTKFPPNGFPLITLTYRNDDGGPAIGKDSRLRFDPPADGEYRVRVSDARGQGGPEFAYRLTVRPPRPDFNVKFSPDTPSVWKGGSIPINVTADRLDEFDGPIQIRLENLPPGFSAPSTFIEAGQLSTTFALFAAASAMAPDAKHPPLKLVATAMIDGKEVTKMTNGGVPKVVDPGDIITTTVQQSVSIRPGHQAKMLVKVERRNGFKGRIPIEVQGLPHGVRVLDIGLNGILVTERDTQREVVIYCDPWVKPMEHPFVVLAKREGKNTDHGAQSVLLRVEK